MLQLVRSNVQRQIARYTPPPDDLDEVHETIWDAISPLFPANAMVDQADYGCLVISWPLRGPRSGSHFAAPIIVRIGAGLLVALWTCDEETRRDIAQLQAELVRDALRSYDPHSRVPSCGVIQLGD